MLPHSATALPHHTDAVSHDAWISRGYSPAMGYIEEGLDADLERWLAKGPNVILDDDTPAVDAFAKRLPKAAESALRAFDAKVRSGKLKKLWLLDMESEYGMDFVDNGCALLDAAGEDVATDCWSLGLDGSGNYWVVRTSGEVVLWTPTDGDTLDPATRFSSLDAFLWAVVRRAALKAKKLKPADVKAEIATMSEPGLKEVLGAATAG